ncbi:fructosamine kinase family protein [Pseudoponticoccus marisrubri]|uniref:Aminoglycoside phosphotransferase n=1 Tax=Pseudoponticoccus marisrubri TaxID=1685382 RepID=A0A0W7WIA2_9RHOB|nr:fructosamine kinase family protein [Pseudoponticoccus marisrubri]KUF10355.1 aminoglycoside phosphotransferase [Pseudoponticoccus marisrubri]
MSWRDEIESVFGAPVAGATQVQGGDLSDLLRVTLQTGRVLAVKRGPYVGTEARMLRAMALAGAAVPDVLHNGGRLLCLEWLDETAPAGAEAWAALGTGLRRMHNSRSADYGWPEDYAFGAVAIENAMLPDWPGFWAERRLAPCLPALPADLARRVETVIARLPDLLPAQVDGALLHGDLWTGNALFSGEDAYMIDPACYHGHSEVDLAMLELFGQPPDSFWRAYGPLEQGRDARVPLYQLWPALVHVRLFGAGYHGMAAGLLDRLGA